jgi:hypothetical protein
VSTPEERRQQRREAERAQRRAEERREAERERAREEARERAREEERREAERQFRAELQRAEERARQRTERVRAAQRAERRERARRDARERERQVARDRESAEARREAARGEGRDRERVQARAGERADARREAARAEEHDRERAQARTEDRDRERADRRREAARAEERDRARAQERRAARSEARRQAAAPRPPEPGSVGRIAGGPLSGGRGRLRTRGRFLLDERDRPMALRGVIARGLERASPTGGTFAPAINADDVALVQDWGANALLVPISQDLALEGRENAFGEDYLAGLDATIAAASQAGMHTVVQLSLLSSVLPTHVDDTGERLDPALPNLESIDLWAALGRRYAAEPAVLFALFRGAHTPGTGDSTGELLPTLQWPLWSRWLLAMIGELRRAHPGALVLVPGLEAGHDLTGFPLRHLDGTEPANIIYTGELRAGEDPGALRSFESLARIRPCGVLSVRAESEGAAAVEALGRRFARTSTHWFADGLRENDAPLLTDRDGRPVATVVGHAVARAIAQPDSPDANLELVGAGGSAGLAGLVARELTALVLGQAAVAAALPPTPWDTADSTGNVLRFPVAARPTREGTLAASEGGLVTDGGLRPRVSVIVGPGATPRGIAEALLPLYAAAGSAATVDQLARAILVYSRNYLPVPAFRRYSVGLRIPLPIEIDAATGDWILNTPRVLEWDATFDPAWAPLLDRRPALLRQPDEDGAALEAVRLLGELDTAAQRGIALLARLLTNPYEAVLVLFEILRLLEQEAFGVALELMNGAVAHQLALLASTTAGSAALRRLEPVLAAPPAGLSPAEQQSLTRSLSLLDGALRPGGVVATAREVPETALQLRNRGLIPQLVRAAPADPPGGLHRMVLGRDVLAGAMDVFPAAPPNFRGPAYIGRVPPGPFIAAHQARLNPLGDARLAARLAIVAAISDNEGALDAVRLRDAGILSTGIHQWSAAFELELPALLWRYRSMAPLEFDLFLRLYELEVRPDGVDGNGNPRFMLQRIAPNLSVTDLATFAQRRSFFGGAVAAGTTTFDTLWAGRFRMASLALVDYALAQALEAADRFDRILRDVGNLNVGGVNRPLDEIISSQHGVALILDQHINRPAAVRPELQAAITAVGAQPDADTLDRAVTNRYAATRNLQDAAARTARIVAVGLDRAHDSFAGW